MPRLFLTLMAAVWGLLLLPPSAGMAQSPKRVALVIGNGAYQNVARLPNPLRDATAIADMFRKAGFDKVIARQDVGNLEFKRALREFGDAASDADIAIIYYAGHGIQVRDMNYMIPVDAKLATEIDAEDEAVSLDRIIAALEPARRLRLVILDACRDNPFARTMKRRVAMRAITGGLGKAEPTLGDTLIAYAAKAGSTAEDGEGDNSPFATALVKHLAVPGLDIRLAFGRIRDEVMKRTANKQEPFVYGSIGGEVISIVPAPAQPKAAPVGDVQRDFELVKQINSKRAWEIFIETHKTGLHVRARTRRDQEAGGGRAEAGVAGAAARPARAERPDVGRAARLGPGEEFRRPRPDSRFHRALPEFAARRERAEYARHARARRPGARGEGAYRPRSSAKARGRGAGGESRRGRAPEGRARGGAQARGGATAGQAVRSRAAEGRARSRSPARGRGAAPGEGRRGRSPEGRARSAAPARGRAAPGEGLRNRAAEERARIRPPERSVPARRGSARALARAANQGWAREDLGRLQRDTSCERVRGQVAALLSQPAPQPVREPEPPREPAANTPELIRTAQGELRRLGCFAGRDDGTLNGATREALQRYLAQKGLPSRDAKVTENSGARSQGRGRPGVPALLLARRASGGRPLHRRRQAREEGRAEARSRQAEARAQARGRPAEA